MAGKKANVSTLLKTAFEEKCRQSGMTNPKLEREQLRLLSVRWRTPLATDGKTQRVVAQKEQMGAFEGVKDGGLHIY